MVLFGLSIFITSISLLCLRHLSRSWLFLAWRKGNSNTTDSQSQEKEINKMLKRDKDECCNYEENENSTKSDEIISGLLVDTDKNGREISDMKAMPPPPLPTKKITSLSTNDISFKTKSTVSANKLNSHLPKNGIENVNQHASLVPRPPTNYKDLSNIKPSFVKKPSSLSSLSPLPRRIPESVASTAIKSTAPAKSAKKVILKPGHSPLDWARLSASSANLSGLPPGAPYLKVPPSLLKQHTGRKGKDAWTLLGNKVYNITPYLPFHPGGEPELLRSAGRDGTKLFTEVHPWVNWEGMLSACFIGIAVEEHEINAESKMHEID